MKNLVKILVVAIIAFTTSTNAQRERHHDKNMEDFTIEQHTNLAVKRLTLDLDLTESQQKQIKPLLEKQFTERKAMKEKRKAAKKAKQKPTAEERYAMHSKMLDDQILRKRKMKSILTKEQYDKFEKMHHRKEMKMRKRMEKHKEKKLRKERKEAKE